MVNRAVYRLGDVADVNADGAIRNDLLSLELGGSPRAGRTDVITRSQVEARIAAVYPGVTSSIDWRGAQAAYVRRAVQALTFESCVQVAETSLREFLIDFGQKIEIRHISSGDRELLVPVGRLRMESWIKPETKLTRRMQVWVDIFIDDEHYRSLPVWFGVAVWIDGFFATTDLPVGSQVVPAQRKLGLLDFVSMQGRPIVEPSELKNVRLTVAVKAGEPITSALIEPIPAVQKGGIVNVLSRVGGVEIQVPGTAQGDGAVGDQVEVQIRSTAPAIKARIISEGVVRVGGRI